MIPQAMVCTCGKVLNNPLRDTRALWAGDRPENSTFAAAGGWQTTETAK